MKKLLTLIIGLTFMVNASAQITEGSVKYTVDFNSSDPSMQAQFAMLKGSTLQMFFSPEFNRVEMNMGMMATTTSIVDIKKEEVTTLMDGIMGKMAYVSKASSEDTTGTVEGMDFEETNETKKIAGYTCKKTIITTEEGGIMNYWTSDKLSASVAGNKFANKNVKGFPLEFEVSTNGMVMKFTATEVQENLKKINKKEIFDTKIPEGYKVVDENELMKMGM